MRFLYLYLYIVKEDRNILTYLYTYLLTPRNRVLEKLTGSQLVKKFHAYFWPHYGPRVFDSASNRNEKQEYFLMGGGE